MQIGILGWISIICVAPITVVILLAFFCGAIQDIVETKTRILDRFRPKWKRSDSSVRAVALKTLDDEATLLEISENDKEFSVRAAALHQLAKVARNPGVRSAAFAKIARQEEELDQYLLKRFPDDPLGKAAIERLRARGTLPWWFHDDA